MQFNLTTELARSMARRLRDAVGQDLVSAGRSLEVLSKTVGLPNWDTLSAMLKAEGADAESSLSRLLTAPKLDVPVQLFVEAQAAAEEYGASAAWARIELTQDVVDFLARKANQCRLNGDLGVRVSLYADEWDESEELNFRPVSAAVTTDDFWLRANPKYADYNVETSCCPLARLFESLSTKTASGEDFLYVGGVLLYAKNQAKDLAETLLESGHIGTAEEPRT